MCKTTCLELRGPRAEVRRRGQGFIDVPEEDDTFEVGFEEAKKLL